MSFAALETVGSRPEVVLFIFFPCTTQIVINPNTMVPDHDKNQYPSKFLCINQNLSGIFEPRNHPYHVIISKMIILELRMFKSMSKCEEHDEIQSGHHGHIEQLIISA